jgi:hypothetical protein
MSDVFLPITSQIVGETLANLVVNLVCGDHCWRSTLIELHMRLTCTTVEVKDQWISNIEGWRLGIALDEDYNGRWSNREFLGL